MVGASKWHLVYLSKQIFIKPLPRAQHAWCQEEYIDCKHCDWWKHIPLGTEGKRASLERAIQLRWLKSTEAPRQTGRPPISCLGPQGCSEVEVTKLQTERIQSLTNRCIVCSSRVHDISSPGFVSLFIVSSLAHHHSCKGNSFKSLRIKLEESQGICSYLILLEHLSAESPGTQGELLCANWRIF